MAKRPTSPGAKPAPKAGKKPVVRELASLLDDDGEDQESAPVMSTSIHPVPIALSRVLGQDRAIAALRSAIASDRIHHAWIFHGPAGVGKFTTALAFAALILDPTTAPTLSGELEADPQSPVQRLIRAGVHPDLHVVTKELALFSEIAKVRESKQRTIPKDVVETHLLRPAALAPVIRSGSRVTKVFIVEEADLLDKSPTNAPVQNSLLKTLEEPASGTVIILVTSSEELLLPTIRSRSQRVGFTPLSPEAMGQWSKAVAPEVGGEERAWLLEFAAGAPGVFELARQGGLYAWHSTLSPMLAKVDQGKYDLALAPTMAGLVEAWAEAWVKSHDNASKESANHAGAEWLFRLLADHFRAMLRRAAMGGQASGAAATQMERSAQAMDCLEEAQRRLGANIGISLVMEGLVADLVGVFNGEPVGA
jgi:DNA polymerase-3 subunit delta'